MSEGSGQGPEVATVQPPSNEAPKPPPIAQPDHANTTDKPVAETANSEPAAEGGIPKEIRTRLVELLQQDTHNPEEQKELLLLLTAGKASLAEMMFLPGSIESKWSKTFAESYEAEDRRSTYAMGAFWAAAVRDIEKTVEKLARTATPPYDAVAMRLSVNEILTRAEKGLNNEDYSTNTGRITGSFYGERKPIDAAAAEIASVSDDFIQKAKTTTPDALVEAAERKWPVVKQATSSGDMPFLLWPGSTRIIEDAKSQLMSTNEGKLVWTWFAESMTDYMKIHYERRMVPLSKADEQILWGSAGRPVRPQSQSPRI